MPPYEYLTRVRVCPSSNLQILFVCIEIDYSSRIVCQYWSYLWWNPISDYFRPVWGLNSPCFHVEKCSNEGTLGATYENSLRLRVNKTDVSLVFRLTWEPLFNNFVSLDTSSQNCNTSRVFDRRSWKLQLFNIACFIIEVESKMKGLKQNRCLTAKKPIYG